MKSKLIFTALIALTLIGSSIAASAQNQPAPGASSEGNVGPGASSTAQPAAKTSGTGMTTGSGMTNRDGTSKTPSGEGNVGPGTNNNGPIRGGK